MEWETGEGCPEGWRDDTWLVFDGRSEDQLCGLNISAARGLLIFEFAAAIGLFVHCFSLIHRNIGRTTTRAHIALPYNTILLLIAVLTLVIGSLFYGWEAGGSGTKRWELLGVWCAADELLVVIFFA